MTDDTNHPLDAKLGGDNLRHLPTIKVERGPRKARRTGRKAKAKPAKARGKRKKPVLAVVHSAERAETRNEVGRPSKYNPSFAQEAYNACMQGATDRELSVLFDVSVSTLYEWRLRYPEFAESLRSGKDLADERAERALYQRVIGYDYDAEKVFANGYRATIREHIPTDVGAALAWLKNRRPDRWRDVQKVDHTVQIKTAAELLEEIKRDVIEMGLLPDGSFGEDGET